VIIPPHRSGRNKRANTGGTLPPSNRQGRRPQLASPPHDISSVSDRSNPDVGDIADTADGLPRDQDRRKGVSQTTHGSHAVSLKLETDFFTRLSAE
jgi:hypothetical protein